MKYFNHSFFDSLTNENSKAKYEQQYKSYWEEFEKCSKRLPKLFIKYYKENGFHDDLLEKLEFIKNRKNDKTSIDVITQFSNDKFIYEIYYHDVKTFFTNITINHYCEIGDYIYGEILEVDNQYMSHEFSYFDADNTILIIFKKLTFKISKRT